MGFGVGVASVAAPLYAAEMAPTRLRGRFVSTYQLAITIGIFVAYLVDELLTRATSWRRWMLGVSAVPGVLLVLAWLPLSDTARWYLKAGRRDDARAALAKVRPDGRREAHARRASRRPPTAKADAPPGARCSPLRCASR